ncbi:helix-turn-helix domain-containing protein [Paenibacillus agricola]|uniref:Helix-turn-helix transcriptional regulator n=1 Tax=Paenibacillus agricola TaxID=2716264 RepID=A0ABX0JET0_9BACL|nr:helix-turn-helix transcriptional regulator [Paenibacillus agricola]NHN34964.1 helix-turn-helix transcriptional regulator [Paenibacillus agricola]
MEVPLKLSRLRSLRKERNMTLQAVAESIGVAKSTYACYELNYRQPPIKVLQNLAVLFNTSVDYIIGATDDSHPQDKGTNAKLILNNSKLHWDGVPLTENDLEIVRDLLEMVVQERISSNDKKGLSST